MQIVHIHVLFCKSILKTAIITLSRRIYTGGRQSSRFDSNARYVLMHILFCCRYLHIGTSSWISFADWRSRFGNLS